MYSQADLVSLVPQEAAAVVYWPARLWPALLELHGASQILCVPAWKKAAGSSAAVCFIISHPVKFHHRTGYWQLRCAWERWILFIPGSVNQEMSISQSHAHSESHRHSRQGRLRTKHRGHTDSPDPALGGPAWQHSGTLLLPASVYLVMFAETPHMHQAQCKELETERP